MKDRHYNLSNLSNNSDSKNLASILSALDKEEKESNDKCSLKDSINKFQEYRTNLYKNDKVIF